MPQILFIGDEARPEFGECIAWLRGEFSVFSFQFSGDGRQDSQPLASSPQSPVANDSGSPAPVSSLQPHTPSLRTPGADASSSPSLASSLLPPASFEQAISHLTREPVTAIIVAQDRPGQYSFNMFERLHNAAPLTPIIILAGSWCEGEARTGKVWPGATRVYAHQFVARMGAGIEDRGSRDEMRGLGLEAGGSGNEAGGWRFEAGGLRLEASEPEALAPGDPRPEAGGSGLGAWGSGLDERDASLAAHLSLLAPPFTRTIDDRLLERTRKGSGTGDRVPGVETRNLGLEYRDALPVPQFSLRNPPTVLVCSQSAEAAAMLADVLAGRGYGVEVYGLTLLAPRPSPLDALSVPECDSIPHLPLTACSSSLAVVLLDCPGSIETSIPALLALKSVLIAQHGDPTPRIILLAGFPRVEDIRLAQANGAARVVSKPFELDDLCWQIGPMASVTNDE